MSAPTYPAPGQFFPPNGYPPAPKNGLGTAGFVLGLLATLFAVIPIIGVVAWPLGILGLIFGLVGLSRASNGMATNKGLAVAGAVLSAVALVICMVWVAAFGTAAGEIDAEIDALAPPAVDTATAPETTLAFGQTWTSDNGNTIVAGTPDVRPSESPFSSGETVVSVPVTLTNNGTEEWATVFTTYGGTLNSTPAEESTGEGDWLYSTPLAPGASVTLTKVFVGGPGEFTLSISTPHGVAFFTGQV